MKEINYELFNEQLLKLQDQLLESFDITAYLNEQVSKIIETCFFVVSDDYIINLYVALFNSMLDISKVEIEYNNILTDMLELNNSIDINSNEWSKFSIELKNILENLDRSNIPTQETKKYKGNTGSASYEGKAKNNNNKIKDALMLASKFANNASTIDSYYYYVENPTDNISRGIYYVTTKGSPTILTDCMISVLSVSSTNPNSLDKRFIYKLQILNKYDEKFEAILSSHDFKTGRLFETLEHCKASNPPSPYLERLLIHAIQQLAHIPTVLRQEETTELGYHFLPNGEIVYVLTNGVETKNGFLSSDKSTFIAPTIPNYANGYKGMEVTKINDSILKEIFCNLNTNDNVKVIMLSVLGISSLVCFPTSDYDGTIPFSTEIIGEHTHGKSPLLNYLLSFFGIDFSWHKATLFNDTLSDGDTPKGRAKVQCKMRGVVYADMDIKQTPKHLKSFEKIYDLRNKINAAIFDNAGRIQLTISREERYLQPSKGALIRTGNFDMATVSLQHDNAPYEKRTCTFIWPIGAYNNETVSKKINKLRNEYYAIGATYRKWCMKKSQDELKVLFENALDLSEEQVQKYDFTNDDSYKNHTVTILTGVNLFYNFLEEILPKTFMLKWIKQYIPLLIQNRVDRTNYIFGTMQRDNKIELIDKILTAIQVQFSNGSMFIHNQQDKIFTPRSNDIPVCGIENIGYNKNKPGKVKVGYLVDNGETIAFIPKLLWEQLYHYSKDHKLDFLSLKHVEELLKDHDIMMTDKEGEKRQHKINNSKTRFIDIPIDKIYPDINVRIENESIDTPEIAEKTANVLSILSNAKTLIDSVKRVNLDSKVEEK